MNPASAAAPEARIALFGGTFDPIHNAHLAVAAKRFRGSASNESCSCRPRTPRTSRAPRSPPGKIAFAWRNWRARQIRVSKSRAPKNTRIRSYSIDTIEKLLALGSGPLAFLIGADAFADIRTWRRWQDVVRLVEFIVVTRPGARYDAPPNARVRELNGLDLPVSSSAIREEIARGARDLPIPPAVLRYIRERGLYGAKARHSAPEA